MLTNSIRTTYSVIALAVLLVLATGSTGNNSSSPSNRGPAPPDPKELARSRISLKMNSWHKAGFDNIMEIDVTIANMNDRPVKDIQIKCTHSAPSGTVIDSNARTIYEMIKANSKRRFRKFNMGFIHSQAERSGCEITDFVLQ